MDELVDSTKVAEAIVIAKRQGRSAEDIVFLYRTLGNLLEGEDPAKALQTYNIALSTDGIKPQARLGILVDSIYILNELKKYRELLDSAMKAREILYGIHSPVLDEIIKTVSEGLASNRLK